MTICSGCVRLIVNSLLSLLSFCTRLAERLRHIKKVYKKYSQIGKTGLSVDVYGYCS